MKREEKTKEMFLKVDAWKQSGMTILAYAQIQGLSVSSLKYWIYKQRKDLGKDQADFVELFPSAKSNPNPAQPQRLSVGQQQGEVVLSFANGLTITINL